MKVPTNKEKKDVFGVLVVNDKESQAIIDLVVKMQSSVEDAQTMLLNNFV